MSGHTDSPPPNNVNDGGSLVATNRPGLTPIQKIGVALLVAVILLAFVWLRAVNHGARKEDKQPDVAFSTGQTMHAAPMLPVPTPPAPRVVPALPQPSPFPMFTAPKHHEETAAESPILAYSGGSSVRAAPATTEAPPSPDAPQAAKPAADTALSARLKPTVLSGVKARLLPHPDMLITEGTLIPCILQTAIDSQLAGYVKCVVPVDIRGTTGNVVLLDKGTTVVGEVQQGLVNGQSRVFVLWDRAETPDRAVIELSSPGTDELGRAGLPGRVNNHWWARFGDAILLSVIQGGLNAGTAAASNSGGNNGTTAVFNSFQSNGSQVADTALQAEINIPPTLEKIQGDAVAIFVAKDLDFSDIYSLRVTGAAPYGQ